MGSHGFAYYEDSMQPATAIAPSLNLMCLAYL